VGHHVSDPPAPLPVGRQKLGWRILVDTVVKSSVIQSLAILYRKQ
jgi:hypothetical protein